MIPRLEHIAQTFFMTLAAAKKLNHRKTRETISSLRMPPIRALSFNLSMVGAHKNQ